MTDARGLPLAIKLTAGQCHEAPLFVDVMNAVRVQKARGRPKQRPEAVVADKAYSTPSIRHWLRRHGVRAVIPRRRDQLQRLQCRPHFDRAAYRSRNAVERSVGWLKEPRRIGTRHEKLALHYEGMLALAVIERYLRVL